MDKDVKHKQVPQRAKDVTADLAGVMASGPYEPFSTRGGLLLGGAFPLRCVGWVAATCLALGRNWASSQNLAGGGVGDTSQY
jgi:hypothetical protein